MNINLVSGMPFGDEQALLDFAFVHRLVHRAVGSALQAAGKGATPNATIDSDAAMRVWGALMRGDDVTPAQARPLVDWLQLHANLHQAEYDVLALGPVPDLSVVDFRDERQFYDWMFAHNIIHDTVGAASGVT